MLTGNEIVGIKNSDICSNLMFVVIIVMAYVSDICYLACMIYIDYSVLYSHCRVVSQVEYPSLVDLREDFF